MPITLKCGCEVTEESKFIVGERCEHCTTCNEVSQLHPFGSKRLD